MGIFVIIANQASYKILNMVSSAEIAMKSIHRTPGENYGLINHTLIEQKSEVR